jgi:hypothetical protein
LHDLDDSERQDLTYRFATAEDFRKFYGSPQRMTTRAVAILVDDEPVGIIGLALGLDCATLYSDAKPEIEPHLKRMTVLRAIKLAMRMVEQCGRDVYAKRQDGTDTILRLGFEHFDGEVYRWRGSQRLSHT